MSTLTLHDAAKIQRVPYRIYFNGSNLGALADLPEIEFGEKFAERPVFHEKNGIADLTPERVKYAKISVKMVDIRQALELLSSSKTRRCGVLKLEVTPPARGISLTFGNVELQPRGEFELNAVDLQYIGVIFTASPDKNSGNLFLYA